MSIFKKKKAKPTSPPRTRHQFHKKQIDESFERVLTEVRRIDDWEDPRRIQRYILDSCEQIIKTAKTLQRQRREEEILSDYLGDIRRIQSLPKENYKKLCDVSKNLISVSAALDTYDDSDLKLNPEQFLLLARNEDSVPDTILRLQKNEQEQAAIKKQMQQMDAKKNEAEIEREENARTKSMMRKVTALLFASIASMIALFTVINYVFHVNTLWVSLLLLLMAVCYVLFLFYSTGRMRRQNRQLVRTINHTISNLNVVRMKYANISSTVDNELNKFGVNSSYELNYLWELYLADVSRKRQKEQDNSDYEFYNARMKRMLEDMGIKDVSLWMRQPAALLDPADLQEVNRKLVSRRGNLLRKIEANTDRIRSERADINDLMREHDYYEPEIVEILSTVDARCGLNKAYKFTNRTTEE